MSEDTLKMKIKTILDNTKISIILSMDDLDVLADALIAAEIGDVKAYNKLAYEVRCNLTSITRYIHNKNRSYNKKYKELAEKAVNNLLNLVNGGNDD